MVQEVVQPERRDIQRRDPEDSQFVVPLLELMVVDHLAYFFERGMGKSALINLRELIALFLSS